MNSKRLKELHPEVYKKFFSENEVVLSMPFGMDRSSYTYEFKYDGVRLQQKLPLRMYIGINKSGDRGKIRFKDILIYNFENDGFDLKELESSGIENGYLGKLREFIEDRLQYENEGVTLSFIAEMPTKMNFSFFALLSFLSLIGVLSYIKKLSLVEVLNASSQNMDEVYYDTSIGQLMKEMVIFFKKNIGIFFYVYIANSFFVGGYQTICFRDKVKSENIDEESLKFSLLKTEDLLVSKNLIEPKLSQYDFSFDLAIIYSGIPLQVNKQRFDVNCRKCVLDIKNNIQHKFKDYKAEKKIVPSVFNSFFLQNIEDIDWMLAKFSSYINLEIRNALLTLSTNKFDDTALEILITAINKILPLYKMFYGNGSKYLELLELLHVSFNNSGIPVGILPFDISRHGGLISLTSPLESNRKKVHLMIDEYRSSNPDSQMCVVYESWKDGYEYEGIKIEQDIRNGIYSEMIERGNCIIEHHDGSTQLIEYSQLEKQNYDDVIVDAISHKILIPGQKLTSKDIHSQTATSEILEIVLQSPDSDVHNSKLPRSAYSKNKNNMTAKITIPLVKLVEKYLNKDLLFTCNGSLSNYTIRISPGRVKFGIVKKIG